MRERLCVLNIRLRRWCIDRNAATAPPLSRLLLDGDREGLWPAKANHPIQDIAGHQRLSFLRLRMTSTNSVAKNRLVSEEGVLHSGLLVIP